MGSHSFLRMVLGRGQSVACSAMPPPHLNAFPAALPASPPVRLTVYADPPTDPSPPFKLAHGSGPPRMWFFHVGCHHVGVYTFVSTVEGHGETIMQFKVQLVEAASLLDPPSPPAACHSSAAAHGQPFHSPHGLGSWPFSGLQLNTSSASQRLPCHASRISTLAPHASDFLLSFAYLRSELSVRSSALLALLCLCEMAATALDTRPDVSPGCSCCAALHIFRAKGTVVLRMLSVLRAMTHNTHVYGYKRHYSFMGTVCDLLSIAPSTVPTVSVATVHNTLCVLKSPSRTRFYEASRRLHSCVALVARSMDNALMCNGFSALHSAHRYRNGSQMCCLIDARMCCACRLTLMAGLVPCLCMHVLCMHIYSYGLALASPIHALALHAYLFLWLGSCPAEVCMCYACILTPTAWPVPRLCIHILCMHTYSHGLAHAWPQPTCSAVPMADASPSLLDALHLLAWLRLGLCPAQYV